VQQKQAD